MLAETVKTLLFHLSFAVLYTGIQLISCLFGKLVKESSKPSFTMLHSFSCGVLISKAFTTILEAQQFNFIVFSAAILLTFSLDTYFTGDGNGYERVSQKNEMDDEDLGIEITTWGSESSEALEENNKEVADIDISNSDTKNAYKSFVWFAILLTSLTLEGIFNGIYVISEKHESLEIYINYLMVGILLSLVFGIICEYVITDPSVYIKGIVIYVSSFPIGILLQNYFQFSVITIVFWKSLLNSLNSGLFVILSFLFMIPANRELLYLSFETKIDPNSRLKSNRFNHFLVIFGYILYYLLRVY